MAIVITARFLIDGPVESEDRMRGYVISAVKSSCRNVRDGTVLTTLYDDDERLIGADLSGTPSEALQEDFDDLVDKLEETKPRVVPAPPPHGRPKT